MIDVFIAFVNIIYAIFLSKRFLCVFLALNCDLSVETVTQIVENGVINYCQSDLFSRIKTFFLVCALTYKFRLQGR